MPSLARVGALVAAGTLVTTGLVSGLTTPAVAATHDPRPVDIGAAWLEGQLTDGLLPGDWGPLYGQSIDAALSLKALKGQDAAVDAIRAALVTAVQNGDYITGEAYADTGSTYAGAVAKTLVLAEETGGGETSFGGVDLVSRLEAQVMSAVPNAGRLTDTSMYGDFANTLGQAFAARGLSGAPSASPSTAADAVSFLLLQQCSDGYFRQDFADVGDGDQHCDAGIAAGKSAPSIDATAIAVQQLQAISNPPGAVTTAIEHATAWLLAHQRVDGSFAADQQLGTNTDSTGLAGAVLAAAGDGEAAARAATWVRAHQVDEASGCTSALAGQTGAIAYDDAALSDGRTNGIGGGQQWRIATAQALPVLASAPAATSALTLTGPAGFVRARSTATYHLAGAAPGATLCVSGVGASRSATAGADGTASVDLTLPKGTAVRVATALTPAGASDSASVQALGARTFKVRPSRWSVHRGGRVHVVVRGLVRGERVVLRLRGVKVRIGKANGHGRFVADVRVGRRLGKARIVARGQFPAIRHGRAVVRVVR